MSAVTCYCGAPARFADNAEYYGRSYGNGKCWMCTRFPECDGYVGTHPDGRPLGSLVDKATKRWRVAVHSQIDPLWKDCGLTGAAKRHRRGSVYGWLRLLMVLPPEECHIGNFTAEQCVEALEQIALHPYEERPA